MKYVTYRDYSAEIARIQEELDIGWGGKFRIIISDLGSTFDDPKIHMGVNWPAIGTVEGSEAREFAETLMKAVEAAANFKYNGYQVKWGREEE